jgi:hypothetical protein
LDERVFDTKRHCNVKSKPSYRLIRTNYKSPGRVKKERLRRNRVLKLWIGDVKVKDIAVELGVSERTVKRDLARIRASVERRLARRFRLLGEEERLWFLGSLEGLSPVEQIRRSCEKLAEIRKSAKVKRSSKILVTFDTDALRAGRPCLKFRPSMPVSFVPPGVLNFRVILDGKNWYVGQFALG